MVYANARTTQIEGLTVRHLTNRWSGRVRHKVRSSNVGARAAQLNR